MRKIALLVLGGILLSVVGLQDLNQEGTNVIFSNQNAFAQVSKINNLPIFDKVPGELKIVDPSTNNNPNQDLVVKFTIDRRIFYNKLKYEPSNPVRYALPISSNVGPETGPNNIVNVVFEKASGNTTNFTFSDKEINQMPFDVYQTYSMKDASAEKGNNQKYKAYLKVIQKSNNQHGYLQLLSDNGKEFAEWYPPVDTMPDGIFISHIIPSPNPGALREQDGKKIVNYSTITFNILYTGKLSLGDRSSPERQYKICSTILYKVDSSSQHAAQGEKIGTLISHTATPPDPKSCLWDGYSTADKTKLTINNINYPINQDIYYKVVTTVIDYGKLVNSHKIENNKQGTVRSLVSTRYLSINESGKATLSEGGSPLPELKDTTLTPPNPDADSPCAINITGLGKFFNKTAENMLCWMLDQTVLLGGIIFSKGAKFAMQGMETSQPKKGTSGEASTIINVNSQLDNDITPLKTAWKYALGLVNFVLLLILIVIGFGTIFHIQIDTYHIKAAIVPIIIGIILANFSLLICRFFLEISNVMTVTFVNSAVDGGDFNKMGEKIADMIIPGVQDLNTTTTDPKVYTDSQSSINGFLAIIGLGFALGGAPIIILLSVLVFFLMASIPGAVMWVLGFLFYARTIFLFILITLSPIAFFCVWWPPLQGFFKKWWNQFLQWTFMVPIAFFFIWAGLKISEITGGAGDPAIWKYVLGLIIIFLAASVPFKMGGAVGAAIAGYAKKYGTSALGAGKGWAGRTVQRSMEAHIGASPRSILAGLKQAGERHDKFSMGSSTAKAQGWAEGKLGTKVLNVPTMMRAYQTARREGAGLGGSLMRAGRAWRKTDVVGNPEMQNFISRVNENKENFGLTVGQSSELLGKEDALRQLASNPERLAGAILDDASRGGVNYQKGLEQLESIMGTSDKAKNRYNWVKRTAELSTNKVTQVREEDLNSVIASNPRKTMLLSKTTESEVMLDPSQMQQLIRVLKKISTGDEYDSNTRDIAKKELKFYSQYDEAANAQAYGDDQKFSVHKSSALSSILSSLNENQRQSLLSETGGSQIALEGLGLSSGAVAYLSQHINQGNFGDLMIESTSSAQKMLESMAQAWNGKGKQALEAAKLQNVARASSSYMAREESVNERLQDIDINLKLLNEPADTIFSNVTEIDETIKPQFNLMIKYSTAQEFVEMAKKQGITKEELNLDGLDASIENLKGTIFQGMSGLNEGIQAALASLNESEAINPESIKEKIATLIPDSTDQDIYANRLAGQAKQRLAVLDEKSEMIKTIRQLKETDDWGGKIII